VGEEDVGRTRRRRRRRRRRREERERNVKVNKLDDKRGRSKFSCL